MSIIHHKPRAIISILSFNTSLTLKLSSSILKVSLNLLKASKLLFTYLINKQVKQFIKKDGRTDGLE